MIKTIRLKFGRVANAPRETIDVSPVTVFVGPNYSGKSKVLQELQRFVTSGQISSNDVILDTVEFEALPRDLAQQRIDAVTLKPHFGETVTPEHVFVGKRGSRHQVLRNRLLDALVNPSHDPTVVASWYLVYNTMILDGKSRINLVEPQQAGDLLQPAHTSFQLLFRDDKRRAELRRVIHDAFGLYLVIDPTNLGQLRLKLSEVAPASDFEERGIHDEAVNFHQNATAIEFASDGLKAFTGMMTEIVAGDPEVLMIDEPEAFLHPALSFMLGKEVARATVNTPKKVFVSTHSPNFVMGCIQSGAPITLVRLTYRGGVATARILPNADVLRLMRNPLLRSTNVLSGLFYEHVVVTESDADRAFYQEVNERLLRDKPGTGIPNCLFINAQNKQTVPTILQPLRQLGIPAAGVVDIDVLKEGGTVWTSLMNGAHVPDLEQQANGTIRANVKIKLEATGKNMKRDGGIDLLSGSDREAAENLLAKLASYGIFVVPGGELESWLVHLGASGHGPQWLIDMFERLGEDPDDPAYVPPAAGDVWDFVASMRSWFTNPQRRGIPGA